MQTTNYINTLSPAKLNLFLHITGKRKDGYHNLQTLFRLLNWGDNMQFRLSQQTVYNDELPIRLHCNINLTDNLQDNLIVKAAHALLKNIPNNQKKTLKIIDIQLNKKIPTGAGLGGGSSNAATTLLALNNLWQLEFSQQQLQKIGVTLGADVPIFIYGQDAIAEGVGDVFSPIKLPKQQFLLLTPSSHISTAQLFAHPKLKRNVKKLPVAMLQKKPEHFLDTLDPSFCNVFEPVVCKLSTKVTQALNYLKQFESTCNSTARMTGSGSCVFLPLTHHTKHIDTWIKQAPCPAFFVESL
ncbi:MAG: 4-(cytidine 5'-diphospho)-2-C-methyl-D-erythritol kinase [Gammaproteobacteria bacterium]|nr:MAG: 4-(cytidine 5'-diphospho)-2-C-methyl-D-erythritol kinase [Gammaproteobacteria bacterium]